MACHRHKAISTRFSLTKVWRAFSPPPPSVACRSEIPIYRRNTAPCHLDHPPLKKSHSSDAAVPPRLDAAAVCRAARAQGAALPRQGARTPPPRPGATLQSDGFFPRRVVMLTDHGCLSQDPDFSVEGMSSTTSTQPSASSGGASTSADENARPPDSARSILSLQLDQRSLHFSVSAWVLIVALIGIFPLAPHSLQYKGYRLSLLGTTCTTGYALYRIPRAGNLQAVQAWCNHVTSSKDFIPFMYCLMFATSKLHLKLVLVPVICWALEHVARFLRRHFTNSSLYRTYLEQPCTWVETNTTAVHFLRSNSEILLGFLMILSLFSRQRNVMQTFMYWQLLKLMYHSPFTAAYHRAIWLKIGRTINPYIHHYTPFLHDPINAGMRWWFR